jgi:hypothetical protein
METTLVKADDKGRVSLRGVKRGAKYLVTPEKNGWRIRPAPKARSSSGMEELIADTWAKLGAAPEINYDKI